MLTKYIVEFIGTFFFFSVILAQGKPIPIAVALLASIYFGGDISGGHFNPAVSVMMLFHDENFGQDKAVPYIISQVLGGIAAYKSLEIIRLFKKSGANLKTVLTQSATKFVTPLSVDQSTGSVALATV